MKKKAKKANGEKVRVQIKYFTAVCNDLDLFLINPIRGHTTQNLEIFHKMCTKFTIGRGNISQKWISSFLKTFTFFTLKLASRSTHYF